MPLVSEKKYKIVSKHGEKVRSKLHTVTEFHPIIAKVLKDSSPITTRLAMQKMKDEKNHVNKYEVGEKYIVECFRALIALKDRDRQVKEAIKFLENRPPESFLKKYKLSHLEFFDYNHNALLAYYVSYSECLYQVINVVLNLGIDEKYVSFKFLESNQWVHKYKLRENIRSLEKLRNNYSFDRNQTMHQGRAKIIDELRLYFSFEFLAEVNPPDENMKAVVEEHKKIRRKSFKWEVEPVLKPIKRDYAKLEAECDKVLDKLMPYYNIWTTKLRDLA